MAANDQLLEQIRNVVREEIKAETASITNRLDEQEKQLTTLSQDQQEQGQVLRQVKTEVEALAVGQREMCEITATKADVLDVGIKVDRMKRRIESIEDVTGIPNPNKNLVPQDQIGLNITFVATILSVKLNKLKYPPLSRQFLDEN